jgi:hypothetical protein
MSQQADLSRWRWTQVTTNVGNRNAAPFDGVIGTSPDFQMSPYTISKLSTTGLALMLGAAGTAVAGAGGFSVTVWVRDPVTFTWAAFATVSIDRRQLFVSYDIDADEIWFQIGNVAADGTLNIGIAEQ